MKFRSMVRRFIAFCLLIGIFHSNVQTFVKAASGFDPSRVEFHPVISGLTQPLFITNAADGSGRLFIVEKAGYIRIFENGSLLPTPFLDIHSIVNSTGSEQGLLGLAFHPGYETNGQFYTVYTDQNGSLVLSRFTRSSTNPDLADSNSRATLLTISHPMFQNHNGGMLAFGSDGYLYWSTGDGGGGGDPSNNAQSLSSLLGKILRLNVDSGSPYSIPASNPFFSSPDPSIRKEIWAYGLRNPWRFSFDRQTGDLYIGDVGQSTREEVDFQPSNDPGGRNYGWRVMEGSLCYDPASGCDQSGKVLPVAEYDHSIGCSITGGYVYRGSHYSPLQGYYFYGDFCTGVLFSLHNDPSTGWAALQVADTPYSISSFGVDENGELYLADFAGGKVYQIQYTPDTVAPMVSSILRASGNPTNATSVYFSVNFSEPVTGVDANDFVLSAGGNVVGAMIEKIGGSGATYVIEVKTGTGGGTLRLDVRGTATIMDLAGNAIGNAPFRSGESFNLNNGERSNNILMSRMADFNGDGKAEVAVFRPSTGTWHLYGVGDVVYGIPGDIPVAADYNGDGKDEIGVFRPSTSTWSIYGVGDFVYGTVGDIPLPADYNGDGRADIAVFRPSTSTWYIRGVGEFLYGMVGDIPVVADYNGDGKADIAVFRPSTSTWYIRGVGEFLYGMVGDIPVVADYNGDGKDDVAIFRPSTSTWYIRGIGEFLYGAPGDTPVVGDYNGDGSADIAVFRPSISTWYIYGVGNSQYGAPGDIPV